MLYTKSLENLFVSKVRIKALSFFLLNPTHPIHLRGAVREFKEEINAVRRELMRLQEMQLLIEEKQGNRKYYKLNLNHPFINELISMFHKTSGLGAEIINNEKKIGTVDFALLTPSFTKGVYYKADQIIDLAVVGIIDLNELSVIIKKYEDNFGKEIHYTVLKPSEYEVRKRRRDDFIYNLMVQDVVMLIGKHEDFVR